ncbi:hypothetical protein HOT15_gp01 [Dickeya phage Dagda]|uniref:Uncharacterized protein n=2 Tax=Aarhusvirus dagda TaxID=2732762 RepID=A0A2S1GSI7_9CAUD|nr:hypothetical protein HOT15_gp01 [Dickeya phage Dagda]AWD92358.1 hypothetical protein [Dickeya phage Dagda]AXY81605.1 hypothetical protein [Dickeya phage Dagda_B1]
MLDSMFHLKDTEVAPPQTTNRKGLTMMNKRYNLNARVLGNTAQAYADRLKTDKKFTIAQTLNTWNMIVEREGKSGTYSFPTTGYTRKAQLIADLESCAAQLRELAECNDTVYDVEQAHKEALLANMPIDEQTSSMLNPEEAPVVATAPVHNKTHFVNITVGSSRVKVKADFQMKLYPRDMSKSRLEESVSCLNEFIKNEFKFTVVAVVTTMGDTHGDLKAIVTVK